MKLRWLTIVGICIALAACGHSTAPSVTSNTLSTGVRPAASPTASPTPIPTPAYTIVDLSPQYASAELWTSADYVNDSGVALGVSSSHVVEFKNGTVIALRGINGGSSLADGGINASGDMAGTALDKIGQPHAVIWHADGSMTVVDQGSKWLHTYGTGINDSDDVVGFGMATQGSTQDGFVYANGQLTPVPVPTGEQTNGTYAVAINNSNVAAGIACCKPYVAAEFTSAAGQTIKPQGAQWSMASGINSLGHLVGSFNPSPLKISTYRAFTFDGTTVHLLPTPPGDSGCYGNAINDGNYVVVACQNSSYLFMSGAYADLQVLLPANNGWTFLNARGISNNCIIVGSGTYRDGTMHAFEMTPINGVCPTSLPVGFLRTRTVH